MSRGTRKHRRIRRIVTDLQRGRKEGPSRKKKKTKGTFILTPWGDLKGGSIKKGERGQVGFTSKTGSG